MKKIRNLFTLLLMAIGLSAIPAVCMAQTGYEYENGGLHYMIIQSEENPMWLEIIQNDDHKRLQNVTIPEEFMIPGYSFSGNARPAVVEKIGNRAFSYSIFNSIEIPPTVRRIGEKAFYPSSVERVKFSEGLISIGEQAFRNCRGLTYVKLPESLRFMEYGCFTGCSSLMEVDLPSSLVALGGFTFRYCGYLKNIYSRALVPPVADDSDFGVVHNDDYWQLDMAGSPDFDECVLHVPAGTEEAYKNAPGWNLFHNIVAIDEQTTEVENIDVANPIEYSIADGVLTISCKAGDIICVYDAGGVCLEATEVSSPCEYIHNGTGIRIVNVNGNSIKVSL